MSKENEKLHRKNTVRSRTRRGRRHNTDNVARVHTSVSKKRTSIRKEMPSKRRQYAVFTTVAFIPLITVCLIIAALMNSKNALAIYMNSNFVGIIKETNITGEEIKKQAELKLQAELKSPFVEVYDTITVSPVHAKKSEMIIYDSVLRDIYTNLDYQFEACQIRVNDVPMTVVRSEDAADELLESIKKEYCPKDSDITQAVFTENVEKFPLLVREDQVASLEDARKSLNTYIDKEIIYEVVSGDTIDKIARSHDISADLVKKLNPKLESSKYLLIGQELLLTVPVPLMSVQTVKATTHTEVIPKKIITRENPDMPVTYEKVIQQGQDGQKEITQNIVMVNGVAEHEKGYITEKITHEPIDEIIEIGTG